MFWSGDDGDGNGALYRILRRSDPAGIRQAYGCVRPIFTRFVTAAFAWSVTSSLLVCPHSLSYFHELVGGPLGGHFHLLIKW